MEYLDEEDVLEVVDDGDMSRAGSRLGALPGTMSCLPLCAAQAHPLPGDGDEGGDLAEEEVEEEAVESGPKEPSGPDTSIAVSEL